jgi:siderophore synthetase component
MSSNTGDNWIDANAAAQDALDIARRLEATQKALAHVTLQMLATLAKSAPREDVDQLLAQLERIRDLTGPAGIAAGEVIATAIATLERAAKR